jgi:hypothetical protein
VHRHAGGQLLPVGIEIGALGANHLAGIGRADLAGLLCGRDVQHLAGLEQVHVLADERVRIASEQRDQHLIERHALRLHAARDPAQRIARAHPVLLGAGGRGRRRCRHRRRRRWRRPGRGARRLRRSRRLHARGLPPLDRRCRGGRHGRRRHRLRDPRRRRSRQRCRRNRRCHRWCGCGCGCGGQVARCGRRIEQQREVAHQAAAGPVGLENHIDEGLDHRTVAGQPQVRAPVGALEQLHLRARQDRVVVHTRGPVGIGRRDAQHQRGSLFAGQASDVDLGTQGFAQRGLHAQLAQP